MHHKRTFMFLEQVILRHGADALCTNIKEIHEVSIFCTMAAVSVFLPGPNFVDTASGVCDAAEPSSHCQAEWFALCQSLAASEAHIRIDDSTAMHA